MTVSQIKSAGGDFGTVRSRFVTCTFDGTTNVYTTGGFSLTPQSCGLVKIVGVIPIGFQLAAGTARTSSWLPQYDTATGKLQLFGSNGAAPAALAEAAITVQVSTFVISLQVIGF
jgi:hypothetical protein